RRRSPSRRTGSYSGSTLQLAPGLNACARRLASPSGARHVHHLPPSQPALNRLRRLVDGARLGDRSRRHGDHDCRIALGESRVQHRSLTMLPFGYKAVPRKEYFGHEDVGTGPLGVIGNIVWLLLAGWWLALGHLVTAILLAVTVIGIPFAWAHLKLAGLALLPLRKPLVPVQTPRLRS